MKKYLLIALAAISCNSKTSKPLEKQVQSEMEDTVEQKSAYKEGKYYLVTFVRHGMNQQPTFSFNLANIGYPCDYQSEISGSAEYIISLKKAEYEKGLKFTEERKKETDAFNDSLKLIDSIKVK